MFFDVAIAPRFIINNIKKVLIDHIPIDLVNIISSYIIFNETVKREIVDGHRFRLTIFQLKFLIKINDNEIENVSFWDQDSKFIQTYILDEKEHETHIIIGTTINTFLGLYNEKPFKCSNKWFSSKICEQNKHKEYICSRFSDNIIICDNMLPCGTKCDHTNVLIDPEKILYSIYILKAALLQMGYEY